MIARGDGEGFRSVLAVGSQGETRTFRHRHRGGGDIPQTDSGDRVLRTWTAALQVYFLMSLVRGRLRHAGSSVSADISVTQAFRTLAAVTNLPAALEGRGSRRYLYGFVVTSLRVQTPSGLRSARGGVFFS